jgi:U6 snRNA-associated Sm-like protein LSm8
MSSLQGYVDRRVLLVLQDGRAIVVHSSCLKFTFTPNNSHAYPKGVLAGFDQKSNIVLADSKERVYSLDEGVEEIPLGLYLVKGEMMFVVPLYIIFSLTRSFSCLVGEIDEEIDQSVDLSEIRAEPIPPIRYG